MKELICRICGAARTIGRRVCLDCHKKQTRQRALERYRLKGRTLYYNTCPVCNKRFSKTRKDHIEHCSDCMRLIRSRLGHIGKYAYSPIATGRLVFLHRFLAEKLLNRRLLQTESVHHLDFDKSNNSLSNLIVISKREHVRLHRYIEFHGASIVKAMDGNDENCWKPLIIQMTTAWLEMTGANVIKLSEIGQSAAEPLKSEDHEEGSETMYVEAETDNAVACDIVQTTTDRASEN